MSVHLIVVGFVVLLLVALAIGYGVSLYNSLVSLKERVDQAKQNIDVLLAQRQEELTKVIDTASEYMEHEEEIFTRLAEARDQASQAETPEEQANADQMVRNVMAEFDARKENYPELQANEQMNKLMDRIKDIENQIADRRELYNEVTTTWNTRIDQIPHVIIANQMGWDDKELWEATAEQKQDVDVSEAFA